MIKRIDFSKENRPYWYFKRVPILHAIESVLFEIDNQYNYVLQSIHAKYNQVAADCPISNTFLPGAVNLGNGEITLPGTWPVGRSVFFGSTGTLPAPLAPGQNYFVVASGAGVIKVSGSYGGAAIIPINAGVGVHTIYAAYSPALTSQVCKVSSGDSWEYEPTPLDLFCSPGSSGSRVKVETAPADTSAYSVNFSAGALKIAKKLNYPILHRDSIQVKITGQVVNSTTIAMDNLPAYCDLLLVGRYYPENRLALWGKGGEL